MIVVADTIPLISLMKVGHLLRRSSGLDVGESEAIILSDMTDASLLLEKIFCNQF